MVRQGLNTALKLLEVLSPKAFQETQNNENGSIYEKKNKLTKQQQTKKQVALALSKY